MSDDLADLYPGFESRWIDTAVGRIFARTGGKGPPLMLLHGYPQTNVMYHRVAPALAECFSLVIPDLPGYGWSAVPRAGERHAPYDKRSMANVMIEVMAALGHAHFNLVGHDRGGRVAYRLALDHPGRLAKLAVLDIVPTYAMWHGMDYRLATKVWHWQFFAQPAPFPETMIGKAPVEFWNFITPSWNKQRGVPIFDERAVAHYHAFFSDPLRIAATCEDYRAGRTVDLEADEADRAAGKKIGCPVLALWGSAGIPSDGPSPLDVWRDWATNVEGRAIDAGHFLCEENPMATAEALLAFFRR